MHFRETFGELVRRLREESKMPLRKVAAYLDIDPSTLSKIERNERSANKNHVARLSDLFKVDIKVLMISYLSDKIMYDLVNEDYSDDILRMAEMKLKYLKTKNTLQIQLELK